MESFNEKLSKVIDLWIKIRPRFLPIANVLAFILMILFNILSSATTLIGGSRSNQTSINNPTLITPAGYAFSIWSLIYTLIGLFSFAQLPYVYFGKDNILVFEKVGFFFIISCFWNILWLFIWGAGFLTGSAVIIVLMLVSVLIIYIRVDIGYGKESRERLVGDRKIHFLEYFLVQFPFSMYMGWLSCATIVNIVIAGLRDPIGYGPSIWAAILLTFCTVLASILLVLKQDFIFSGTVCWAIIAIGVNQKADPIVATSALVNASLVGFGTFATFFRILFAFLWEKFLELQEKYYENKEIQD